jgi:ribonuclease D
VSKALAIPAKDWPKPKPRAHETPRESTLAALATAVVRGYCLEEDLAFGLAATQKSIKDLIRAHAGQLKRGEIDILKGWRGKTIGSLLDEVLAGARTISVGTGDDEPVLRTTPCG